MIVRFGSVTVASARRAALAAVAAALVASAGAQHALAADAAAVASAASGASAPAATVGQYTVRVGQSLNDVAADLAQTRDPATLARVSRALFDANPDAFMKRGAMKRDPSLLKIGAVLNVPAIPGVAVGASGASSSVATGASATAAAVAASASGGASAAAGETTAAASAPVGGGGSAAAVAASAASAAAPASAVATSSPAAAGASAPTASASVAGSAASASAAVAAVVPGASASGASDTSGASAVGAASAAPGSDAHVWTGAIQAASSSAGGANAASAAHAQPPVSSIQELLALKNRVLMALQEHGIGKHGQTGANAPSAAAPGNRNAAVPAAGAARSANEGAGWSPSGVGIAAAFAAVVLLLLIRLAMRRRRQEPPSAVGAPSSPGPADGGDAAASRGAEAADRDTSSRKPEPGPAGAAGAAAAASVEPQHDETLDHAADAAGFAAATSLGADALPPTLFESPHGAPLSDDDADAPDRTHVGPLRDETLPRGVEPGEPETLADASGAASLDAAATLGADALPPDSIETARVHAEEEAFAQRADDAQHPRVADEAVQPGEAEPPVEPTEPLHSEIPPQASADAMSTSDVPPQTSTDATPTAQPQPEPQPTPTQPAAPTEFPADAIAALDTLNMPLPPRVAGEQPGAAPLPTGPVASPEAIERQSVPLHEPSAPLAGGAIEAGTAGPGSIAGLGAARFGALSLDFDLNLPPDSAEPLPVFTPEQLARIARNKLDLAHEYVALGDLTGARTLIHEVIESNDPATRADAQALLATLAPMS